MFCSKCGNEVQDGQAFCPSCGNNMSQYNNETSNVEQNKTNGFVQNEGSYVVPNSAPNQSFNMAPENQKKGFNKKLLIPIIGGIAALIVIIIVIVSCSGGGPKGAIKDYMNAIADNDPKALANAIVPKEIIEKEIEEDGDEDEFYDEAKEEIEDSEEELEKFDIDVDSSYSLTKKGNISKKRIKEINKTLKEYKDVDLECTDGEIYKMKQDDSKSAYFEVRKINGKWYVQDIDDDFDSDDVE